MKKKKITLILTVFAAIAGGVCAFRHKAKRKRV